MPMNRRTAIQLIRKQGGKFVVHGANHDEFEMPWGTKIQVPRHKRDFSIGVEKDIIKKATEITEN